MTQISLFSDDTEPPLETKKCYCCEKIKPVSHFSKDRGRYRHICKKCKVDNTRSARRAHRTAPSKSKVCDCCGIDPKERTLGILLMDHDHETGAFRGWICDLCNVGIGKLGDNLEGVMNAVNYLKRTKNKTSILDCQDIVD